MTQKKKVSQLPLATTAIGLYTIGVDAQGQSVKVPMVVLKGDKGDRFVYSDFTPAQLEQLKVKGDRGEPFTYEDFTAEQIQDLKQPSIDAAATVDAAKQAAIDAAAYAVQEGQRLADYELVTTEEYSPIDYPEI